MFGDLCGKECSNSDKQYYGPFEFSKDPILFQIFKFRKYKNESSWLVQLVIRTKRRINDLVNDFPINMNEVNTKVDLNIIPLGSYDYLIDMDWIENHHVVLYCYNKDFECLD
jgi:hypothetical protein